MCKDIYGVIYKIHNKKNNKLYIGQTIQNGGFKTRYHGKGEGIERVYNFLYNQRKYGEGYNQHLLSSIDKYGFNSFEVDEEFDIAYSQEELNKLEYMYIALYNLTDSKCGYNKRNGGDNYKLSDNSSVYIGKSIICIDDGKIYKSISSASREYNISPSCIKSTFKKKHSYTDYKKEEPIFRKIDNINIDMKCKYVCHICGKILNRSKYKKKSKARNGKVHTYSSSNQKYCKKCREMINYKNTKRKIF